MNEELADAIGTKMTEREIKELAFRLLFSDDINEYRREYDSLSDEDKERVRKAYSEMLEESSTAYCGM